MDFTRPVTSSVEDLPDLRIVMSAALLPPTWTMLVCGALPSRTLETSRMKMVLPFTVLIGMALISSTSSGLELRMTGYSCAPILAVPPGTMMFCAPMTALMSRGESPAP